MGKEYSAIFKKKIEEAKLTHPNCHRGESNQRP